MNPLHHTFNPGTQEFDISNEVRIWFQFFPRLRIQEFCNARDRRPNGLYRGAFKRGALPPLPLPRRTTAYLAPQKPDMLFIYYYASCAHDQ